jgi:FlgD Ig-like domain
VRFPGNLAVTLGLSVTGALASPAIQQVRISQPLVDPARGDKVDISFVLSEAARATVRIYDGRNWLVRDLGPSEKLSAGEHSVRWDGRDRKGQALPPEAYVFTVTATGDDGAKVTYDPSDQSSGTEVPVQAVAIDRASGEVSYVLAEAARVRIRLGLDDHGPLLRTLIDWVPRSGGLHREAWDGWDATKTLRVREHPRLVAVVSALRLPDNTILVGPPPQAVRLSASVKPADGVRVVTPAARKRMFAAFDQPIEERGDVTIEVSLPEVKQRTPSGLPIVHEATPVRLDVSDALRERVLKSRFEPVFFVDGQFAFENEVGFLPMNWIWNPSALAPGEHFLTVNLRGYEGNFGIATLRVQVDRPTGGSSR